VDKGAEWYWALGLITIALAVAAIMFNNMLFAVFWLVAGFALALFAARKPKLVKFAVTQRGVRVDESLYPFQSLESFAIDELSPNHTPKLILQPKTKFAMRVIIPLESVDADHVHDFLREFLPEEDHVEPLSHRVMEWLGF
jgi:hypothetical protein